MSKLFKVFAYTAILVCFAAPALNAENPKAEKTFSINLENTDLQTALELLAEHAGYRLVKGGEFPGVVNYSFSNVTLEAALRQITRENNLVYKYGANRTLVVSAGYSGSGSSLGRTPASVDEGIPGKKHIKLKYLKVNEINDLVNPLLGKEDRLIRDEPSNSVLFVGSDTTFTAIMDVLNSFDVMPQQILIEAHIVELNKNKSRELGFSYGDLGDPTLANVSKGKALIKNPEPSPANFALQLGLGNIDGAVLSARLAAAEVEGSAKILSRPKVVTINNKSANITSGISYSIRTLAAVSGGSGGGGGTVSGGVTTVSAGLNLSVTPTIVGDGRVKLGIAVSNSEPDETTVIDGIPGIITNSTNTEIIVADGKTASVAGLVKNTFAESETGVPWLSKVPVLGWLFSSHAKSNRDKELMVFITPRIVDRELKQMDSGLEKVKETFPEVKLDKKAVEPVAKAEAAKPEAAKAGAATEARKPASVGPVAPTASANAEPAASAVNK